MLSTNRITLFPIDKFTYNNYNKTFCANRSILGLFKFEEKINLINNKTKNIESFTFYNVKMSNSYDFEGWVYKNNKFTVIILNI